MSDSSFEWDNTKDGVNQIKHGVNQIKHGVSFADAQFAFLDENRIIAEDLGHSSEEKRFYCFGYDQAFEGILTVRFTYRHNRIRIFGAGYWRKGKKLYEKENKI